MSKILGDFLDDAHLRITGDEIDRVARRAEMAAEIVGKNVYGQTSFVGEPKMLIGKVMVSNPCTNPGGVSFSIELCVDEEALWNLQGLAIDTN
jgi:hypothetical protein